MSKKYAVGQSKVKTWRNCRQAYDFKYEQELIRKRTKRPFVFGRLIHKVIENQAEEEQDPIQATIEGVGLEEMKMFTAEKEMYGEILEDMRTIMADYLEYWKDPATGTDPLELVAATVDGDTRFSEHEFAMDLDDEIVFKGQIDGFAKTPNKLRWLLENKSFDNLPGEDERWRNLQSVVYIHAALELGLIKHLDGVAWNYVRSKPPTVPQLLKDGSRLSDREIITLPSVVRRALAAAKLREADHQKLMTRAEACRSEYFQRIFTPINAETHKVIWDGFLDSAREMLQYHGRRRDKNIGRHCGWCDYEPLCRAELTGSDVDFVKEREFEREDPEHYRRSKRSAKLKVIQPKESREGKVTSKETSRDAVAPRRAPRP